MLVRVTKAYIDSTGSTLVPLLDNAIALDYISPINNRIYTTYISLIDADLKIREGKHTLFGSFLLVYYRSHPRKLKYILQIPRDILYSIQQNIEATMEML
jgi:hypothetical protein